MPEERAPHGGGPDWGGQIRAALAQRSGESSDFDLNPGIPALTDQKLRPAAVLIGIMGDRLILTKRASHLKHHAGQIAFPGGKSEARDVDAAATALREAEEEIGLAAGLVRVLGRLPEHETVTGFAVTPILAEVSAEFVARPDRREVEEVFQVPLAHVLDPRQFRIEGRHWRGEWRRYYVVPWGPYYIWGATARILRGLAERMAT